MANKVKLIIGNEREIEDKINETLKTLPNAELKFPPTPILAPRGLQFSVCIVYSVDSQEENGGEDDNSGEDDGGGESNKEADDNADKSGSPEKPDGKGKKTVKP